MLDNGQWTYTVREAGQERTQDRNGGRKDKGEAVHMRDRRGVRQDRN